MIKCSFNTARRIKDKSSYADLKIQLALSKMKVVADDSIPDHIIFLCDKKGEVLKMVNVKVPFNFILH